MRQDEPMRILLVQPRVSAEPAYPLALAGVIPLLHGAGHTVRGVDNQLDDIAHLYREIASFAPDWVGASVMHHNAGEVAAWMEPLTRSGRARTFVIGALPSLEPGEALARTGAEFAVIGVAEETVADLVDAVIPETTPGVGSRVGGQIQLAPRREPSPLSLLPFPDRSVFPIERYSYAMRSTATPYAAVMTARGCKRFCPYCPVPKLKPRGFDARPPVQIAREWRMLVEDHGVKAIHVEDDSFLADEPRVRALCLALKRQPLGAKWELVNGVRPSQVNRSLLAEMAEAGCSRVVFSFEHLSDLVAPAVGVNLARAKAVVAEARAAGMRVGGYFIVGLPGVDLNATLRSVRSALRLGLDDLNFICFYPTPGAAYTRAATSVDATTVPRWLSKRLTRLGQLAFFARPSALKDLSADMIHTPGTTPVLAAKAWEVLFRGGPIPMRDTP
jgi:radical SAM superfamily enzyme YgiQ (UPF0313 family)